MLPIAGMFYRLSCCGEPIAGNQVTETLITGWCTITARQLPWPIPGDHIHTSPSQATTATTAYHGQPQPQWPIAGNHSHNGHRGNPQQTGSHAASWRDEVVQWGKGAPCAYCAGLSKLKSSDTPQHIEHTASVRRGLHTRGTRGRESRPAINR